MKTSLIQLKAEFKIIQEAHEQINSFFWGAPDRAVLEDTINYPLMCCYVTAAPVNLARRVTSVSIAVVVVDKVFKDYVSLDDTISDTLQVVRDIQNTLHSPRWLAMIQKPTASGSKIFNSEQDEISGWGIQFKIDIKDDGSYCNLPMAGYNFESPTITPGDCAVATIINSTATYFQTVASGATFQLPDITHIDTDGSPVVKAAQTPMVCSAGGGGAGTVNVNKSDGSLISTQTGATPATDYNVTDSAVSSSGGAYSASVKATEALSIPDASITVDSTVCGGYFSKGAL